jgi:two-component sensor histidine kinase
MTDQSAMVCKLLRQQAAIAAFGTFALRERDLPAVLDEAARVCAHGLDVPYAKICRYRPEENDLVIEAGYGWNAGVIGYVVPHPDARTPQGRAFSTGQPFICNIVEDDDKFALPQFYADHGVVSIIDVLIKGDGLPYGVLEIDSTEQHDYDHHDVNFLTGFANVLGEAVATADRIKVLAETVEEMRILVEDKSRLLDQKKMLAEELQHRVRNNLQLVYGMLSKQIDDTTDEVGRRGLKGIARRVFTLAQVYEQLLGTELTRTIDFSGYLDSLCLNLVDVQGSPDNAIKLECTSDSATLDLDVVTCLGIIVTELVTNSFDHAFPSGEGIILVSLQTEADTNVGVIVIKDNGTGFVPVAESKRHGLGLVRRLSEQIGGSTAVEIGQGTTWTITFPISEC